METSITFTGSFAYVGKLLEYAQSIASMNSGSTALTTGTVHQPGGSATADETGPVNTNAPAADSAGLPWDERIHSANKQQNTDGTWRKRRGVTAETVSAVEAELKMRGAQQSGMYMQPPGAPNVTAPTNTVPMPGSAAPVMQPYAPPPAAPPQYPPVDPQMQPQQQAPQYAQPPAAPPQYAQPGQQYAQPPAAPPVAQPPAAPPQLDFGGFMQHISVQCQKRDANGQPVIYAEYLAGICQRLSQQFNRQVSAITDIAADQNMINAAQSMIIQDGRWFV